MQELRRDPLFERKICDIFLVSDFQMQSYLHLSFAYLKIIVFHIYYDGREPQAIAPHKTSVEAGLKLIQARIHSLRHISGPNLVEDNFYSLCIIYHTSHLKLGL